MNGARQVPPASAGPTESQLKKRKGPEPAPAVDSNPSTKRAKPSQPGGLVPNWKKKADVGLMQHIARKNPIEFVDDENDPVEGEFDQCEGQDTLNAVRAAKPSTVRIDSKSVSRIIICNWT